jgi:hypothetical protein
MEEFFKLDEWVIKHKRRHVSMEENKLKHLDFIQNAIVRMAQNSFLLKGWTVTLVAGLLAFANIKELDYRYIILAYIPAIFFWLLDGYYLRQERLFRKLYDEVRLKNPQNIDFSMNTSHFNNEVDEWMNVCFSMTLRMFYLPILIVIILAMIFGGQVS